MSPGRATSDEQTCYRRNEYSTKRLTNKYKKNVEKLQRKKKTRTNSKTGYKIIVCVCESNRDSTKENRAHFDLIKEKNCVYMILRIKPR